MTERKRAEGALRASEGRLRDLLATLDLGASMARDLDGTIRFWSEGCARLYGWSAAEAVGQDAHALLRTAFPVPRAEIGAALERDGEWTGDLRQWTRDGAEVVVAARKMLRRHPDGRPVAVLKSLTDVSAQRLTKAALRASEARLRELQAELLHVSRLSAAGEMAAVLAHELNQPLTAAASAVQAARRTLASASPEGFDGQPPEVREAMDLAAEQARRAGQIVRRLRDFVARGEADPRLEGLPRLVEESAALALVGAAERGIVVSLRVAPGLPPVLADRIQIEQVLFNLMRNAPRGDGRRGAGGGQRQGRAAAPRAGAIRGTRRPRGGRDRGGRHRPWLGAGGGRTAVRAFRLDQGERHGRGPVDLPLDRGGAWRAALGRAKPGRRLGVPLHLAGGAVSREQEFDRGEPPR